MTTVSYTLAEDPVPYTNHTLEISGQTTAGTGSVSFTLAGTARSLPLLDELRAGLSAPPNATTGWDYMEFDVISTLGVNLELALRPSSMPKPSFRLHRSNGTGCAALREPSTPMIPGREVIGFLTFLFCRMIWVSDDQYVTYARTTITIGAGEEGNTPFGSLVTMASDFSLWSNLLIGGW